jgi:hypothetical protein
MTQTGLERNARMADRLESQRSGLGGKRKELRARVRELIETNRAQMTTEFSTQEEVHAFCETIKAGRKIFDRTCIQMEHEILTGIGAETNQLLEFIRSFGVEREADLRQRIEAYNQADAVDTLTAIERLTTALEAMLPMHPEHRGVVIQRLGGYLPVESDSREGEVPGV